MTKAAPTAEHVDSSVRKRLLQAALNRWPKLALPSQRARDRGRCWRDQALAATLLLHLAVLEGS